jgi:hypothetical protein
MIRLGYVSNSSSSSFIIASVDSPKLLVEIDVEKLTQGTITTLEELDEYFLDERGSGYHDTLEEVLEEEWEREAYEKCKDYIDRGVTLYYGWLANDCGESEEVLLYEQGLDCGKANYEVIQGVR